MDKKFLEENAPMYCVIPANLLLDTKLSNEEKFQKIMELMAEQTKEVIVVRKNAGLMPKTKGARR